MNARYRLDLGDRARETGPGHHDHAAIRSADAHPGLSRQRRPGPEGGGRRQAHWPAVQRRPWDALQPSRGHDHQLGVGAHPQGPQEKPAEPADSFVRGQPRGRKLGLRTGSGQAAQCELERTQLLANLPQRPQSGNPACTRLDRHGYQLVAELPVCDENLPAQQVPQGTNRDGGGR